MNSVRRTYHDGLYCIDHGKVQSYDYPDTDYQNELDFSNIRVMVEDSSGRLWVSIYGGVGLFNPENGQINLLSEQFPELKKYKVARKTARLILFSIREVSSIIRYSKTMRELYGLLHNMA